MADYKKIVLTGGPCAGKTTAEAIVKEELTKLGYKVFFLSETATDLLKSGISPETVGLYEFQKAIADLQLKKEAAFDTIIKALPDEDKPILICDRGVNDNKAFCANNEMFEKILYDLNVNAAKIRDSYDAVFHLVTAAKGAEQYYGNATNPNRRENLEEARIADTKLINAWTGHSHLRVIDNEGKDIHQKFSKLISDITHFLGEPNPFEIERKFIIKKPDLTYLENLPNCHKVKIAQTYLESNNPNIERRVRQKNDNGAITYYYTEKSRISDIKRIEHEKRITSEEYSNLLLEQDYYTRTVVKDRYCLMENNQYFEIDVYPYWNDQCILEIELENENQDIIFPDFLHIMQEVTNDLRYTNHNFAIMNSKEFSVLQIEDDELNDIDIDL